MELLMQKMDNIAEELKAKDKLLARTEVQARGTMESLKQQMDNITEELKAKDLLLAEVQATGTEKPADQLYPNPNERPSTLSPPPLNTYGDEDTYMGDSEGDNLREERRFKKWSRKGKVQQDEGMRNSDTESESYKTFVRKKKGKGRQVVEDEGISESDRDEEIEQDKEPDENENKPNYKNCIDINFACDDEVIEEEVRPLYYT